jgi:hypothetical protein
MGVGMLQCTLPLYLSELAPTQLRGFYINAYSLWVDLSPFQFINADFQLSSWFVVGQIFASVALKELSAVDPYEFRIPIYTQVRASPSGYFKIFLTSGFSGPWLGLSRSSSSSFQSPHGGL